MSSNTNDHWVSSNSNSDLHQTPNEKAFEIQDEPRCAKCLSPAAQTGRNNYWCVSCAIEVHRHPTGKAIEYRSRLENRFWSKVAVGEPDQCWNWTATAQRYGKFWMHTGRQVAHRVAYMLFHDIPATEDVPGDVIRHKCHNELCCNPRHLQPGTQSENLVEACVEGDRDTEFTDDEVRYIRREYQETSRVLKDFADEFDVSEAMISGIVNRDYYDWVE